MEVTLEAYGRRTAQHIFQVSILILMEVTLEALQRFARLPSSTRFNPYSNGSYSGRTDSGFASANRRAVSILILMEVTLEVYTLLTDYNITTWFQSLF